MVTVKDYTELLMAVDEVENYLLMRVDGQILAHNVADPDGLSSLLAITNLSIKKIQKSLGFHHFNHLFLKRDNQENLILLKIGSSVLGVIQKPNTACSELLSKLSQIQEQLSTKK
jgi:hypothetical protein